MRVKLAVVDDASAILDLQKLCYQFEAAIDDYSIPPLQQTVDSMRDEFENKVVLKAVESGRIIGSVRAFVKDDTCFVDKLIVHPEFQNKGIGKKLLGSVESIFISARRFELFAGEMSAKNLALYGSMGYREFKREPSSGRARLVYMQKLVY